MVSKKQNITTIADFISARYGKRQTTAIVVTMIALLATIPYIALQLKALSTSFLLLQNSNKISGDMLTLSATLIMALFAIFFGTRKVDVTEYRSGLMLAIAFESMVKLFALMAVAGLALYTLFTLPDTPTSVQSESIWMHWSGFNFFSFNFIGQSLMAAAAIICLPRQFHVTSLEIMVLSVKVATTIIAVAADKPPINTKVVKKLLLLIKGNASTKLSGE